MVFRHTSLMVFVLGSIVGCQADETIRAYSIPATNRVKTRLLAAWVQPVEGPAWFFKLSGPEEAVRKQEKNFYGLWTSLNLDPKKERPFVWKAPEGWMERPGTSDIRVASFTIPGDIPLETTVVVSAGSDLDNVNRWRKQLMLPPLTKEQCDREVRLVKVKDDIIVHVTEMSGMSEVQPVRQPRMADHPPIPPEFRGKAPAPPAGGGGGGIAFSKPESWKPAAKPVAFSIATFDANGATVSLSPLGGGAGGLEANINRWRGQLRLEPWTEDQLKKEAKKLTIEALKVDAIHVDLVNAETKQRIVGAIFPYGGSTWFAKMMGTTDAAERAKADFESFVKSFRPQ